MGNPDIARLSAPGILPATNPNGLGNWLSYDLDLTFDGLAGVLDPNIGPNFYRSNGDPTAINGTFTGIFQMKDDPDGFFRVDLNVTKGDTFGFVNAPNLDPSNPYLESTFGSGQVNVSAVPAPPSLLLAGFGVAMGLMIRRQRALTQPV